MMSESSDTHFPTPISDHVTRFPDVYEPAEDSFLLMDALQADVTLLRRRRPLVCVEVGAGAGAVLSFAARMLGPAGVYLATDINPAACRCTALTARVNDVTADVVTCDLVGPLRARLAGAVDLLLFNPPYVVTEDGEVGAAGLAAAWAGGARGRRVTDRLLPQLPALLSARGLLYLVLLAENAPQQVCEQLAAAGLRGTRVLSRRCGAEQLHIYRFSRAE